MTATDEFKHNISKWIKYDDQIKEASSDIKQVRKYHKELKEKILKYMDTENIGQCNIQDGDQQLSLNYRDKKIKPKKTDILRKMSEYFENDKEKAIKLYDLIFENCETEVAVSLTRKLTAKGKKRKHEAENDE